MQKITGEKIFLRPVILEDCNQTYLNWLLDPMVSQCLETRWQKQSLETIKSFVQSMLVNPNNYLFAIIEKTTNKHIGNIKLGPINTDHLYADVSYFIGDRNAWGKGYASEAVSLITKFGFEELHLHKLQAGVYASNKGSIKILEKEGYKLEGRLQKKLWLNELWEDHLWFGILK